jgi:hypothetical protein
MANADTTYYAITNDTDWEVGIGTYSTTGPTLARTTILASSNGGSAVSWGVGVKNIFISYAASKSVYLDANGDLLVSDKIVHAGDTNTAIRFPTADTVAIDTGGTERFKVENSTITTTVPIVLPADPTLPLQAATKEYVDTLVASGIHFHQPVRVESPINLNATYNNGTAGVGATLTNAGTQAALVIDGVTVATNDRVLVYQQTTQTQNGAYVVTNTGSGSTNWVLTRAADADSYVINNANGLSEGSTFFVQQGTTGAGETYTCNTSGVITFGTTAIVFAQISNAQIYSAGAGLALTGTVFSNTAPDQTVTLTQGGATTISGTYPNFTITSTDTTYSAGNGIGLAGTTFSVAAGSGLTQDASGLSHADTSSQSSVDNSGATFVQDVTLDTFGHVTGLASVTVTPSLIGAPSTTGVGASGSWGISVTGTAGNVTGTVAIANGGTGATTAAQALSNLGLTATAAELNTLDGITATVTELNYTDGVTSAIQTQLDNKQPLDADLTAIAALAVTDGNFIVGNGTAWVAESGATARTSLGLGSLATASTISDANWSGTDLSVANGGTGASDAGTARTNLGLAIGSNVQAYDAGLQSISGLTTSANQMIYTTASDTYATTSLTAAGRAILDDADAAAQRTTLGLGTIATQNSASVTITGGTISGITDLAIADGGTGASDAGTARTNLGLAIGTNVQAWDANLDQIAALAPTADNFIVGNGTAWILETPAQALASLGVTATAAELNFVDGVTSNIQTQLDAKANIASPALTGTPTAPTAAVTTNTTQIATTAFVNAEIANDAPTKTGGGASGTWAIDISGNAATATTADQIDGVGFRNTGSNSAVNADTLDSNGITYYTSGVPNFTGNATDGALYSQAYSSSWQHQIAADYRSGQIALRGKNNGTFQAWRTVLDSSNYTSYAPSLTGGGASGDWNIQSIRVTSPDGDRVASNKLPTSNPRSVRFDFATAGSVGTAGNYAGVMTYAPWDGTSASTGDSSYQLAFGNASGVNASGPATLWFRNGINSTWNGWQVVLNSSNYTSYAPSLTGSGASGTWGINVTGNAATTSQRAFSGDISTAGQGRFTGWYSGGAATGAATEVGVSGGQGFVLGYNRDTAAYIPLNISASSANMNFNGGVINVSSGALQQGGNQVLHAGNYTSYAPSLTGSGASGTWGINVTGSSGSTTGNAATVTTVTTAQVGTATAGLAAGAVGSYAFLVLALDTDTDYAAGNTFSGSNLRYAGASATTSGSSAVVPSSGTPSGTWRNMGYLQNASSSGGGGSQRQGSTVFLRIS